MTEIESNLLQRFRQAGDTEAFAQLTRRYAGMVYGTCLRITGNQAAAADAAQETFYEFSRKAKKITGSLSGWLHQVATRRAIDLARSETSRARREQAYAAERPLATDRWTDVCPLLDEALGEIDEASREVLIRHFLQGETTIEIAAVQGVSQPTVSRQIEKALAELRGKLRMKGLCVAAATLSVLMGQAAQAAPTAVMAALGKVALAASASTGTGAGTALATGLGLKLGAAAAVTVLGVSAYLMFAPQEPSEVLHFPKDRSLGSILVQEGPNRGEFPSEAVTGFLLDTLDGSAWERRGLAQGDIRWSPGQRVKLIVDPDAWQDLSPLKRLAPDSLYEISLDRTRANDQAMASLVHLTGLRSLNLTRTAITDRGLADVARLRSLKWLALPEQITDEGLAQLAGLHQLEGLLLAGKGLSDRGLAHLRRIPTLRVLRLNGQSGLEDAALAALAELPRLESVSLGGASKLTDAGVDLLVKSPSLRYLDLLGTQVTPRGVARLAELPSLEHLDLNTRPGLDDDALAALSRLRNLKRLRLGVSPTRHYTEKGLAEVAKLERLELLHLSGPGVTDAALRQVAKLPRLRELFILDAPLGNAGLAALASTKSLQVLDLRLNRRVTLGGLAALNPLTNLRALYAMGGIDDDGQRLDISGLTNLTDLILEVATKRLRADDLVCFERLTNLRSLQLGGNAVDNEALAHLRGLTNLLRLRIGGPEVTDAGLAHLANLKQLEDLTLTGNISDVGLEHLAGLTALATLRIYSSQNLSPDAGERLQETLPALRLFEADKDRRLTGESQQLKAGAPAPSFTLPTLDGREVRLSDLRGKTVLLYFWATWCTPCVASMPSLKEFYARTSRRDDFTMIGLSLDDSDEVVRRFVEKHQLPWHQARIGRLSRLSAGYGVPDQAPFYVLIGPDGKVVLPNASGVKAIMGELEKLPATNGKESSR